MRRSDAEPAQALIVGAVGQPVAPPAKGGEPLARGIGQPGWYGRTRFFSYDASGLADKTINSCGQQAIATILDFWNAADFGLPRNHRGEGDADDGQFHRPPAFVEQVMRRFPPTNLCGLTFSTKEGLTGAFRQCGLQVGMVHSAAFGDGRAEEAALRDWILRHKLPAVCLVDNSKIWGSEASLHWALICGWSDMEVLFASWGQVYRIAWGKFREAWHCPGLPWPNNFLALFPYRPPA